ncbi:MAG TPA: tetratricopeptide repeat protein [Candidatus Dormibacteraeota bacterium]|nr:tetratricopeptide repeat protein [Candidatus Dormibacteraeota bacterium]
MNRARLVGGLAKAAIATLLQGPIAGAAAAADQAVDLLVDWVAREERPTYESTLTRVARGLERLARSERIGADQLEQGLFGARQAILERGLSAREIAALDLDPERVTRAVLSRAEAELGALDEPARELARTAIRTVYATLLSDPDALPELERAFQQAALTRLGELRHLPEEVVGALRGVLAAAALVDHRRRWRRDLYPPSALLRAEFEAVPFYGREETLDDLLGWANADRPLGIRVYTGAGGMGKTRLLIELCGRMDRRWRAGFLNRALGGLPAGGEGWLRPLDALFQEEAPLLVVVDYAETRSEEVVALLRRTRDRAAGPPVRIVLLARSLGDWWVALTEEGEGIGDLLLGPATATLPLPPLAPDPARRRQLFEHAAAAFRALVPDPVGPAVPSLEEAHLDRALYVLMAALAAVQGERPRTEEELLDWALRRELGFLDQGVRSIGCGELAGHPILQCAAVATLAGSAPDRRAAAELLARAPLMGGQTTAVVDKVAELLHRLYPGQTWLQGVLPDLLGEHLIESATVADPGLLRAMFGRGEAAPALSPEQRRNGLTRLTRLAQRHPERVEWLVDLLEANLAVLAGDAIAVARETGDPLGTALARALRERPEATSALAALHSEIPEHTVSLREVARLLAQAQVEVARASGSAPDLARSLNNLSNRLGELGRREEALEAVQEAVRLYRPLAEQRPEALRPDLAGFLNNLSIRLSELGQREEALQASQEAVELYRPLVERRPDAFRPHLARFLNNLSLRLAELGRPEEALQAIQEAVELRRSLAERHPDAFRPDLALSLNNLSIRLGELGRREEALRAIQEAVELRRPLAEQHPDAFRPDLALSLNNLSIRLAELGRREEALQASQEAVELYRPLAEQRPDAFRPYLAGSLNNLSIRLAELGRREEALQASQEAVELYRWLADRWPKAFRPQLIIALGTLSKRLTELDRPQEARAADEEARRLREHDLAP